MTRLSDQSALPRRLENIERALRELSASVNASVAPVQANVNTAQETADSKGQVIYQATAPTGDLASNANLWISSVDNVSHLYDENSNQWVEVVAGSIKADALDGKTITGATVQTAASGTRVVLKGHDIGFYASDNSPAGGIVGYPSTLADGTKSSILMFIDPSSMEGGGSYIYSGVQIGNQSIGPNVTVPIFSDSVATGEMYLNYSGDTAGFLGFVRSDTGNAQRIIDASNQSDVKITANSYVNGSGWSILPSATHIEFTATATIPNSTSTFVTGWTVASSASSVNIAAVSGNTISLNAAGVWAIDVTSTTGAATSLLTGRNYLQLQTSSTIDSGRIAHVSAGGENMILCAVSNYSTAVNGNSLRVAAYQTTGASQSMTFNVRLSFLG